MLFYALKKLTYFNLKYVHNYKILRNKVLWKLCNILHIIEQREKKMKDEDVTCWK